VINITDLTTVTAIAMRVNAANDTHSTVAMFWGYCRCSCDMCGWRVHQTYRENHWDLFRVSRWIQLLIDERS